MIKPHNQNNQDIAPVLVTPTLVQTTTSIDVLPPIVVSHDTSIWFDLLLVFAVVLILVSGYKIIKWAN
jgi:hypothetical protein